MKIKRICKICGVDFIAIKGTQFFHNRKCFKKDYYVRMKSKINDMAQHSDYPTKACSFCQVKAKLNFDPLDNPKLFNAWSCPACGCTNQLIWDHQNSPSSYQIISGILLQMAASSKAVILEVQYQTYQIPIQRLENSNPSVVVMTCETIDILKIQKGNRKKILFN